MKKIASRMWKRKRDKWIMRKYLAVFILLSLVAPCALADYDFGLRALTREMAREMEEVTNEYMNILNGAANIFGYDLADLGLDETDKDMIDEIPEGEYIEVTYDKLLHDLEENAFMAARTYKDQLVCVEGKLSTIDSAGEYICIESEWNYFDSMICYIRTEKALDQLMKVKSGKTIKVYGKITDVGEVLGYYMDVYDIQ